MIEGKWIWQYMYYNTSVSLVAYIEFEVDLFDILHIDISDTVQCLGFSYHMYGKTSGMGKLNVYYTAQNGSIFRIFSRIGNLGDAWRREFIQIPPTRGLQVRLSLCKFIPTHPRPEPVFLLQIHAWSYMLVLLLCVPLYKSFAWYFIINIIKL